MHSSVHRIPFPGHEEWYVEGTLLRRAGPSTPTAGRPIALILHGALGHRHYLYQRTLCPALPLDTFTFDFRSNARSPGPAWDYAGFSADVEDVHLVARWLREQWGYRVRLVVGHSRGAVVGIRWVWEDARERKRRGLEQEVSGVGNVSGRYRMEKIRDISRHMVPDFDKQGFYDWHVRVAGQSVSARVHKEDIDRFAAYDNLTAARGLPGDVHVLTVHGMRDLVVPTYDGVLYAGLFERRGERREGGEGGTSKVYLIEEADHNYKGHYQELNDTIVRWWRMVEEGTVQSGWMPPWEPEEGEEGKSKL